MSTLGGKSVESLAVYLIQKGFQNEIIDCLEGTVVAFYGAFLGSKFKRVNSTKFEFTKGPNSSNT